MKKKIGLFLGNPPYGGGNFQYNLTMVDALANLPQARYETVVVSTQQDWRNYLQHYEIPALFVQGGLWGRALGRALRLAGMPLSWYRAGSEAFHPIVKALLNQGGDLWVFPSQDPLAYQAPVPALVTIHDLMHRYESSFPEVSAKGEFAHREAHYRHICHWARGVLVESEVGRRQVWECYGLDRNRIYVLPTVPPKYIYASPGSNDIQSRYGLPEKFIFYPAQFWAHKNHARLVKAVARLKSELPDLKLVLVGAEKNSLRSIQQLVQDLGLQADVLFLGYVPDADMPEFYRRARALIMPTFFGPTNIPPLEAMALGCPAAVSDIYGMREQLKDAAHFFDQKSVEEIARAIKLLWSNDDLCRELSRLGLSRASQWHQGHFNQRFQEIIADILDQPK